MKIIFLFITFAIATLFLGVREANAEKGWGWVTPHAEQAWESCGVGGYNSSLRIQVVHSVTGAAIDADSIKIDPREPLGFPVLPEIEYSGSDIIHPCWSPSAGVYIRITEPGYQPFFGGYYRPPPFDAAADGKTAIYKFHLVRSVGGGGCTFKCASIETVAPGGATFDWYPGNPPLWRVRARKLPNDPTGSTHVQDWLLNINQVTNCAVLPCPGGGGYVDNNPALWPYAPGSILPTRDITGKVNAFLSTVDPLHWPGGALPSGEYRYTFMQSGNGPPTTDPDTGFTDEDAFGVDRDVPDFLSATWTKPGFICTDSPTVYEGEDYNVCGIARDDLSGLRRIDLYSVVKPPGVLPAPGDWVFISSCGYAPVFPNTEEECESSDATLPVGSGGDHLWYRACAEDQVGNRTCEQDDANIKVIEPWLETFGISSYAGDHDGGGNIGSMTDIGQRRDPHNPLIPPPPLSRFTGSGLITAARTVGPNITSRWNWVFRYNIDMTSFPQPAPGNSIYDALWEKYAKRCTGGPKSFSGFTRGSVGSAIDSARNNRNCNVAVHQGSVSMNNNSWTAHGYGHGGLGTPEEPGVVFIPGEFDIDNTLKIENDNGLIFVVRDDIDVDRSVTRVDGFFITDGSFYTDYGATSLPADDRLVIRGSVISFGNGSGGGVDWRRDGDGRNMTSALNRTTPSEVIMYQPKYLWLFRNYQGDSRSVFTEVPP